MEDEAHGDPEGNYRSMLVKAPRNEIREYVRILRLLDQQQHLNISAHLYSAYLISRSRHIKRTGIAMKEKIPRKWWVAWPRDDAPIPPIIEDKYHNEEPRIVPNELIERLQEDFIQRNNSNTSTNCGQPPEVTADQALSYALDEVYQRIVNKRIHDEKRVDVEPIVEPEPTVDQGSEKILFDTVNQYIPGTNPQDLVRDKSLISWKELGIQGRAKDRLVRLFEKDYVNHIFTDNELYEKGNEDIEDADDSGHPDDPDISEASDPEPTDADVNDANDASDVTMASETSDINDASDISDNDIPSDVYEDTNDASASDVGDANDVAINASESNGANAGDANDASASGVGEANEASANEASASEASASEASASEASASEASSNEASDSNDEANENV